MKGYSVVTGVFGKQALDLLARATRIVEGLPEIDGLRCHELARAVGAVLGLTVADGRYGMVEHSWLFVPAGDSRLREPVVDPGQLSELVPAMLRQQDRPLDVLDVYAVGSLPMVRLIYSRALLPHEDLYRVGRCRTDIDQPLVEHLAAIAYQIDRDGSPRGATHWRGSKQ